MYFSLQTFLFEHQKEKIFYLVRVYKEKEKEKNLFQAIDKFE